MAKIREDSPVNFSTWCIVLVSARGFVQAKNLA
jgi:hypothetical protein